LAGRPERGRDILVDTDYLVVGAGASGLAFADALVAEADVEVTLIDRRRAPGGHWLDSYPFVRLHTPSAYYGVNSLALGGDRIDKGGANAGYYERATGQEVCAYFADVAARLRQTGRVRLLARHDHLGAGSNGEQVRDLSTGEVLDVGVRRKTVDARYLEASIPATHVAPFDVASCARLVPVNDLPAAAQRASFYVVLGSGKTAADACIWLLCNGVEPDRIR
jgi:NAD(P)-binding Rossmann-like domain